MDVSGSVTKVPGFTKPVRIGSQILHGDFYVVEAQQPKQEKVTLIDNAVLLIDTSSSMRGGRLAFAKILAKMIATDVIPAETTKTINTFDSAASEVSSSTFLHRTRKAIDSMTTGSGTNILAGAELTQSQLNKTDSKKNLCIVFTDGDPYPSSQLPKLYSTLKELREKNDCTILVFGMGEQYNEQIVKRMAEEGIFWFHASPTYTDINKLKDKLKNVIDDIQTSKYFISGSAAETNKASRISPVVTEIVTKENGRHMLRFGYTQNGAHLCLSTKQPQFTLIQQEHALENPTDLREVLEITDVNSEKLTPQQQAHIKSLVLQYLIATISQEHDLIALNKLQKINQKDEEANQSHTIAQNNDYLRHAASEASFVSNVHKPEPNEQTININPDEVNLGEIIRQLENLKRESPIRRGEERRPSLPDNTIVLPQEEANVDKGLIEKLVEKLRRLKFW